jgi:hypothetical protein
MIRYGRGRSAGTYVLTAALTTALCLAVWPLAPDSRLAIIPISFLSGRHIRWTPLWELAPAFLAAAAPALLAGDLPHVEHFGRRRLEPYAALAAAFAIATTAAIPILTGLTLPPGARLGAVASNVALIAGLAFLLASLLGPTVGPLLTTLSYAALVVTQHSSPEVAAWLPFGGIPENPGPHWPTSSVVAMAAVIAWSITGRGKLVSAG